MPLNRHEFACLCAGLCAVLVCGGPAWAAPTCGITATPMVFGNYDPLSGSPVLLTSTVTVTCITLSAPIAAIPYTLSLGASQTSGTMSRSLAGPLGARLQYNLYTSAGRTVVWGNGSGGTQTVGSSVTPAGLGIPATKGHTVHGRLPAQQNVRVGAYADSVIVTIDY